MLQFECEAYTARASACEFANDGKGKLCVWGGALNFERMALAETFPFFSFLLLHTNTDKQTRTHRHRHAHTKTDTPQLDLALIKTTARSFYASFCWFCYSPRLCAVARAAAVAVMRPSKTENCNQRCLALLCFACMVALLPLLPPLSRLLLLSSVVFCLLACAFLSPPPPRCCYSPSSPPIPECFCLCVLVC